MKTLKLALPAAILAAGFLICGTASYGKQEYAKKEKKACTYCHVAAGKKDLNDTGKCYLAGKYSLEKCPVPAEKKAN
ncbi:MAG: hypothetical protein ABSF25_24645 [Bryobacteraceae bacterium]|jgi:hypothetical protein